MGNLPFLPPFLLSLKIINGFFPDCLCSLPPGTREQRYDLKNTDSFLAPECRTDAFKTVFSTLYQLVERSEFLEVRSLSLFKTNLIGLVRSVKGQLYAIHEHSVQILIG